jgi:hypothetical protein
MDEVKLDTSVLEEIFYNLDGLISFTDKYGLVLTSMKLERIREIVVREYARNTKETVHHG